MDEENKIPGTNEQNGPADPGFSDLTPDMGEGEGAPAEMGDAEAVAAAHDEENALDKNVRLLSPTRMVMRRFFRSKLSVIGLVMIVALFLFSWFGPIVYNVWGEIEVDRSPKSEFISEEITIYQKDENGDYVRDENGDPIALYTFHQVTETRQPINTLAPMSWKHLLGTDISGTDVFTRLMYGGRISLLISFIAVFFVTFLGIVFGGIAGFFGRWVDNIIMRICDILMCLPSLPILLILGVLYESWVEIILKQPDLAYMFRNIDLMQYRIYFLMFFLSLISWPGTARLVRGQILYLREQEYMVAAEAMGFSTARKIFMHLIPNVMPQLIVSMTLGLGGMILQEASLSFLNLGVQAPYAAWGTMVNVVNNSSFPILESYFNVWGPPGICIIIAVLGFNFIGDGLRDALDPKARR